MNEREKFKVDDLVFLPSTNKGNQLVKITSVEELEELVPDPEENIANWSNIKAIQAIQADGTTREIDRSQAAYKTSLKELKMLIEQGKKLTQRQP